MSEVKRPRWLAPALECAVACGSALAFFATCYLIRIKPTVRMGQIAGLAALSYRFIIFAVPIVVALIVVAKRRPQSWDLAVRLACAAFAGLSTAFVAGGVLCMLRGTPYGLGGDAGDAAVLAEWARRLKGGQPTPGLYPPLQIHLIAWISEIQGVSTVYAVKYFQIVSVLAYGPAAYGAWRLLLRPTWALGIGVVSALPMLEAYRLYPFLVLAVFLPVAIYFLDTLRRSPEHEVRALVWRGAVLGSSFGLMFLMYSGWFEWSAPGFFIAAVMFFPWRRAPKRGAIFCGSAAIAFAAFSAYSIWRVMGAPPIQDAYAYFDSSVEPAYIAMWRGGLPGAYQQIWPPIGELGGVGLFTVILCVGWGAAIVLGAKRTVVIAASWIMVGAWFMRMYYAHRMWQTKLVQLYPRTTAELLYCLLALTGFAIYLYVERARTRWDQDHPLLSPWVVVAELCALGLLFMSSGSALTDKYMPREEVLEYGHLAWLSHHTPPENTDLALHSWVTPSSESLRPDSQTSYLVDNDLSSIFATYTRNIPDHPETVILEFPKSHTFSRVELVPGPEGFPRDFTVDVWNGEDWLPRVTEHDYPTPHGAVIFGWDVPDRTNKLRIHATRLGKVADGYGLELAEVEVYRVSGDE